MASDIPIVEYIHQCELSDNWDLVLIEVVVELPKYDEYSVE